MALGSSPPSIGDMASATDANTVWLSGVITTFMSKVVMPTLSLGVLIGVPAWVYVTMGRLSIRSDSNSSFGLPCSPRRPSHGSPYTCSSLVTAAGNW